MAKGRDTDSELLRKKAMLLLNREKELFQFRQERARTKTWLDAFHALSIELQTGDERALVGRWAALLVEQLGFQVAGAYRRESTDPGYALEGGQPSSRLPAALAGGPEGWEYLKLHPAGRHELGDAPMPLERLATDLNLKTFHWLSLGFGERNVLLVAGFSSEAAPFHTLTDADHAQYVMLGNHLGALLHSVWLLASLEKERTELQRSNEELERANARTRAEMGERLALEARIRHKQKLEALGQLTAGIAHEVNNPLAYVLASLHFCQMELESLGADALAGRLSELRTAVGEAVDGGERIKKIIRDVTHFARPDEGLLTSVDVGAVLQSALKMCKNEMVHRARLVTEIHDVPLVVGDARRLEQVFINLLSNAAKAMTDRPGGSIRVIAGQQPGVGVCVEIHDDGPGIPPEIADRVCDPFFTTRPMGQGTGLGLWVCRSVLHAFGGRLELGRSASGGVAARVFLKEASPEPSHAPLRGDVRVEVSPERRGAILIVDDEPMVARSIARFLPDHDTRIATSVEEALALYAQRSFDVVLCDLMMPGPNGMDLFSELQARGPEHVHRMIFMTGGAFTPAARDFVKTLPNACLEKPLSRDRLREAIGHVLALAVR